MLELRERAAKYALRRWMDDGGEMVDILVETWWKHGERWRRYDQNGQKKNESVTQFLPPFLVLEHGQSTFVPVSKHKKAFPKFPAYFGSVDPQ